MNIWDYLGTLCYNIFMRIRHGKSGTPEYTAWCRMRQRVMDRNSRDYKDYGGRGIKICSRWLESFQYFYDDMGDKPTFSHSLDRIDNDGNYEPSNCKWSTKTEQALNRRPRGNKSGYLGVYWDKTMLKYQAMMTHNKKHIHLGFFEEPEVAAMCVLSAKAQLL